MGINFRVAIVTLVLAVTMGSSRPVQAATYNVDIFGTLPDGVSQGPFGQASTNACSATTCAGGFNAAYTFVAQPGDTINLGTLSLNSFIFGDGRQQATYWYFDDDGFLRPGETGTPLGLYNGSLGVSFQFTGFIQLDYIPKAECVSADPGCVPRLEALCARPIAARPHPG
jgi:hypothetical protein